MKKLSVALAVCCGIVSQSFATEVELSKNPLKKDSITFNTAYLNGQYTNKQLVNFGLEFINTTDRILKNVQEQETTAAIIASSVILFYCDNQVATALHETGHGLRAKSYGVDYQLLHNCCDKSPFKKDENFFKFFLGELFNIKRPGCLANIKQMKGLEKSLDKSSVCNCLIIYGAGGLNN
ncbi:hypothetical protein AGMMS49593_03590 [Endomicrobiia bacterium]|nr:hypothetical protein AGMMS49593_03590 [Endomicrobiia bacterium]